MEVEAYCVGMLVLITAVVIVQNSVYLSVIIFVVHIPDVILVGVLFDLKLIHFNFFISSYYNIKGFQDILNIF